MRPTSFKMSTRAAENSLVCKDVLPATVAFDRLSAWREVVDSIKGTLSSPPRFAALEACRRLRKCDLDFF